MPSPLSRICDCVYATIYSEAKTGKPGNTIAIVYWARSRFLPPPLMIIDWDIVRIEGMFIESWLPAIYMRLDQLSEECKAQLPHMGAFVYDKGAGSIIYKAALRKGMFMQPVNDAIAKVEKDERAVSASSYVHQGMVKFSYPASEKEIEFEGVTANHLMNQIQGFAPGSKGVDDELLNSFSIGVAIGLGAEEGL